MPSNAQKLGHLMLHKTANENTNSVSYYDPDKAKVLKLATSGTAYRHWSSYGQTSASANSTTGVDMNKKFNLNFNAGYQRLMTVMFRGYISGGAYYFSWAIKNFTTGNMVPCMIDGVTGASVYGGTGSNTRRTISTIMGNQTFNCGVRFIGNVHSTSSQMMATFDVSNESHNDQLGLIMNASSGSGTSWYSNPSQTLYAEDLNAWMGVGAAGIQYDLSYAT